MKNAIATAIFLSSAVYANPTNGTNEDTNNEDNIHKDEYVGRVTERKISEQKRYYDDLPELAALRSELFGKDHAPHVWYLLVYMPQALNLLDRAGSRPDIGTFFLQLTDELRSEIDPYDAKIWLDLIPQARRDYDFFVLFNQSLSELYKKPQLNFEGACAKVS